MRRALVAANWKMFGAAGQLQSFAEALQLDDRVDTVWFPPAVYLGAAVKLAPPGLACGAQDIGTAASGAHTGEISAEMVADVGGTWVIVGHSERRLSQNEGDDLVGTKTAAALRGGLHPIVCVGETAAERDAGHEKIVVQRQLEAVLDRVEHAQLDQLAIGYEPVWAIGTGVTASPEQAQEMHDFVRQLLAEVDADMAAQIRIVYGGSVKPDNAPHLFAQNDIDGALVGGASLDAADFSAIVSAAAQVR
ncbi:MAG: triose-phosphate isomerase [bacterium]